MGSRCMRAETENLEAALGHAFHDRELLIRALTHRSLCYERHIGASAGPIDNEQLEFLGDSILGFLVSEHLVSRFPGLSEGKLSKIKAHVVSAAHLYSVAQKIGVGAYLQLGRGEEMSGGREKRALLANAVEALIAAVYLDGGIQPARAFVLKQVIEEGLPDALVEQREVSDYKGMLQERVQMLGLAHPRYSTLSEAGPHHAKTFVVEVRAGQGLSGCGEGSSKKAAGQRAARDLLRQLDDLEPRK